MEGELTINSMTVAALDAVRKLECEALKLPQVDIETTHALHAGIYARTVLIPAGVMATGSHTIRPTILILDGYAIVRTDVGQVELRGHHVILGQGSRKQAVVAIDDSYFTMLFATNAKTVEEAEAEFTDEAEMLMSRRTGGVECQA